MCDVLGSELAGGRSGWLIHDMVDYAIAGVYPQQVLYDGDACRMAQRLGNGGQLVLGSGEFFGFGDAHGFWFEYQISDARCQMSDYTGRMLAGTCRILNSIDLLQCCIKQKRKSNWRFRKVS
jgi:hypothetical protein